MGAPVRRRRGPVPAPAHRFLDLRVFPGTIYSLLERSIRYPQSFQSHGAELATIRDSLEALGRTWSDPLHGQARRHDIHDLGFMIQPHMRARWELYHDTEAFETVKVAAENLVDMDENFVVIVDSMCNMDLLYYIAAHTGRQEIANVATTHSKKLLATHLRKESRTRPGYDGTLYSTCHVVNFGPDGQIKGRYSAQGYDVSSTWSRGQAWAILGYAQSYLWTKDPKFLDAARGLAEYYTLRMEEAPAEVEVPRKGGKEGETVGRYVPLWDFDAPIEDPSNPVRDTSGAMVAANGMLVLSQALAGLGLHSESARYLEDALRIAQDVVDLSVSPERRASGRGRRKPGVYGHRGSGQV
ncbi:unnamed protein product [Parascedosporium putredinis]|uniref:Uncharacterized protein n=1 Tax=Parascedosporium putredinis TaxID=1442378 RepID=A0A9P1H7T2_9PEZI|nr:unnamed protein product [Parascedosporium putredinis]CAI8001753.1 unnamed protein product [Parascedosporium putredinis]